MKICEWGQDLFGACNGVGSENQWRMGDLLLLGQLFAFWKRVFKLPCSGSNLSWLACALQVAHIDVCHDASCTSPTWSWVGAIWPDWKPALLFICGPSCVQPRCVRMTVNLPDAGHFMHSFLGACKANDSIWPLMMYQRLTAWRNLSREELRFMACRSRPRRKAYQSLPRRKTRCLLLCCLLCGMDCILLCNSSLFTCWLIHMVSVQKSGISIWWSTSSQ